MERQLTLDIKCQFYEFLGTLSPEEICSNNELINLSRQVHEQVSSDNLTEFATTSQQILTDLVERIDQSLSSSEKSINPQAWLSIQKIQTMLYRLGSLSKNHLPLKTRKEIQS